jgi:ABC-2 type transport system ATP-binding protein
MAEPTTGLDPNQIREVRNLIRSLGASKTILLSTHILQEVEAVAGRVVMIDSGRLVFDGTPAGLLDHGPTIEQAFYKLTGNLSALAAPAPPGLPLDVPATETSPDA